ncbi:MAG: hypothetical protein KJ592_02755, partial [Nanoarchaeota archaeon]|nr:hypothetical protein [Nanoarchaeota archaeon]
VPSGVSVAPVFVVGEREKVGSVMSTVDVGEGVSSGRGAVYGLGREYGGYVSCLEILNNGKSVGDGVYTIDPSGDGGFEVYCYMEGDWSGATLVISKPASVAGNENQVGATGDSPPTTSSVVYSKFSDERINAINAFSPSINSYIARANKDGLWDGKGGYCVGFVRQSCTWAMSGTPGPTCNNGWRDQDSTVYCARSQSHGSYRGVDGHTCANSDGASAWGSYAYPTNQFMIFEHSGGAHYCGGWDTTWNRIELLIR